MIAASDSGLICLGDVVCCVSKERDKPQRALCWRIVRLSTDTTMKEKERMILNSDGDGLQWYRPTKSKRSEVWKEGSVNRGRRNYLNCCGLSLSRSSLLNLLRFTNLSTAKARGLEIVEIESLDG